MCEGACLCVLCMWRDHICVPVPCLYESAHVSVYVCVNMCVLEELSVACVSAFVDVLATGADTALLWVCVSACVPVG